MSTVCETTGNFTQMTTAPVAALLMLALVSYELKWTRLLPEVVAPPLPPPRTAAPPSQPADESPRMATAFPQTFAGTVTGTCMLLPLPTETFPACRPSC